MTRFLLDTNVVSELTKERPSPQAVSFLQSQRDLWLPTIGLYELEYGLLLIPAGRRRNALRAAVSALIDGYSDRILPLDSSAAAWAARFRAQARRSGNSLKVADALIAGTGRANNLTIATRNTEDFDYLDVEIVNPWDYSD